MGDHGLRGARPQPGLPPEAASHLHHPRGEPLRQLAGRPAQRRLCRGRRRVRPGARLRGREAQGLGLPRGGLRPAGPLHRQGGRGDEPPGGLRPGGGSLLPPLRHRPRAGPGDPGPHRGEEPPQRVPQFQGPSAPGDHPGGGPAGADRGLAAGAVRLLSGERWGGRGHRHHGGAGPPVPPRSRADQGDGPVLRRLRPEGARRPRPVDAGGKRHRRPDGLSAGGDPRSPPRAGPGHRPRLLHHPRAHHLRGLRLQPAGPGPPRRGGRCLRGGGGAPGEHRRGPEVLRTSHRGERAADGLRGVQAAAGQGGGAPAEEGRSRPGPLCGGTPILSFASAVVILGRG